MSEQKFVYVDVDYLKELEETAKKVDYYKGIIDGINMVADRKTEPQNYCDDCLYTDTCDSKAYFYACTSKATISKMEQVDKDINVRSKDEPQTDAVGVPMAFIDEAKFKAHCLNCQRDVADIKCLDCDGDKYFLPDEPQTERSE